MAGCGMRVKMKVGHGMTELLMAGCGIEIFRFALFDRRDEG